MRSAYRNWHALSCLNESRLVKEFFQVLNWDYVSGQFAQKT